MFISISFRAIVFGLISFALGPLAHADTSSVIRIGGTGSGLGTMAQLGQSFEQRHPNIKVTVHDSMGSSGGIRALQSGAIDIAIAARPLKPTESNGLIARPYARTPFVIASHPGVPMTDISLGEWVNLLRGKPARWTDGTPVRVVLRPDNDTDTRLLREWSEEVRRAVDDALARPGMLVATTDQDAAQYLETIPGTIGVSSLSLIAAEKRPLKIISVGGVKPAIETLQSGRYPYAKTLYWATRAFPAQSVKLFLEFVESPEGQAILKRNGQIPLSAQPL